MKKLAVALAIVCVIATGCGVTETGHVENESRLFVVDNFQQGIVFIDKETGVQYIANYRGGITVMVDSDGKPLIWNGDET